MSDDDEEQDAHIEAIHISTDIAVRLIQGDFGTGNSWRVVQTMGAIIEYIRDLSMSGDADSVDLAGELIGIIVDNMVYLTPLATDEEIDLEVQRARSILDEILNDPTDKNEEQ